MLGRRAIIGSLVATVACGTAVAAPPAIRMPQRIVSLNPCLDAILVRVADRTQIAALSHWSRALETSTIARLAATVPTAFDGGEDVVALRPDLVLTGRNITAATRDALGRLGIRTVLFDVPETVAASLAQVRQVAALVGQAPRGDALVQTIEAALAAAAPPPATRAVSALVFMPGGFVSGSGTLMDALMARAGFANAAARYGLRRSGTVALEALVADPPEVLLVGTRPAGAPGLHAVTAHPVLARLSPALLTRVFPEKLLFCGGPVLIAASAVLAAARDAALQRRP